MLEVWLNMFYTVMGAFGKLGFLTVYPSKFDISSVNLNFPCSYNIIRQVAVIDLEIEAIR